MGDSIQVSGAAGEPVVPWIPTRIDRLCLEKKALRAHIPTIKGGALTALFISATAVIGTAPEQSLTALFAGAAASVAGFALTMRQAGKAQRENNRKEYFFVEHGRLYQESESMWNSKPYHPAYDLENPPPTLQDLADYSRDDFVEYRQLRKACDDQVPYHTLSSNKDPCYQDQFLRSISLGGLKIKAEDNHLVLSDGKSSLHAAYGFTLKKKELEALTQTFKSIDRFYANGTDTPVVIDFSRYYKTRHGSSPKLPPPFDRHGPEVNP